MVSANNSINDTVGASISGVTNTLTITNSSNTASSQAKELITVGGSSAGDPWINWNVNSVTDWSLGIDNDDSDKWKLSEASSLGTNDTIVAYTGGEVTKPRQPSFRAQLNSNDTNQTGDGTQFYLGDTDVGGTALTSIYDIGSNFSTSGSGGAMFTAPVDGIYIFGSVFYCSNISSSHNDAHTSLSSTASFMGIFFNRVNFANMRAVGNDGVLSGSCMAQLSASDTVRFGIRVAGGSKTINIRGFDGSIRTVVWGALVH